MSVERAAELQRYVETERRVLGEIRDREALVMERGADSGAGLNTPGWPIADPWLRRGQRCSITRCPKSNAPSRCVACSPTGLTESPVLPLRDSIAMATTLDRALVGVVYPGA